MGKISVPEIPKTFISVDDEYNCDLKKILTRCINPVNKGYILANK